jgi:hypothetical protein
MGIRERVGIAPTVAALIAVGAAAASACGGGSGSPDAGPPPMCREAPGLGAGPYFTDVTDEWFPDGRIDGDRFTFADLDQDGWVDLVTHPVAAARPTLDADPPVLTWRVLGNVDGARFEDRSIASGYGAARDGSPNRSASFAVAGDFDNDGDLDLFSGLYADVDAGGQDDGDRADLFLNDGAGVFSRVTPPGDLEQPDLPWHAIGAAPLDYDADGNLDVYTGFWYLTFGSLYGQQDRLYRGDGAGGFTETTVRAGLETTYSGFAEGTNHRSTYGVSACDVDDDGDLDLLGSAYGRAWNQHYRNDGGEFVDIGLESGFAADAITDYSDNEFYRCWCQSNPGACDPQPPAPIIQCGNYWNAGIDDQPWRAGGNTFTTACGDADGDGDLDLFVSAMYSNSVWMIHQPGFPVPAPWPISALFRGVILEIMHGMMDGNRLYLNQGGGRFRESAKAAGTHNSGWAWGGIFLDADNDADLDLYVLNGFVSGKKRKDL